MPNEYVFSFVQNKLIGTLPANIISTMVTANIEVAGLQGILDVYKNAFQFVSLSGPTLFAPYVTII